MEAFTNLGCVRVSDLVCQQIQDMYQLINYGSLSNLKQDIVYIFTLCISVSQMFISEHFSLTRLNYFISAGYRYKIKIKNVIVRKSESIRILRCGLHRRSSQPDLTQSDQLIKIWKTSDKDKLLLAPLPSPTAENVCNCISVELNIDSEIYTHQFIKIYKLCFLSLRLKSL